jgi:hypothetical protein
VPLYAVVCPVQCLTRRGEIGNRKWEIGNGRPTLPSPNAKAKDAFDGENPPYHAFSIQFREAQAPTGLLPSHIRLLRKQEDMGRR